MKYAMSWYLRGFPCSTRNERKNNARYLVKRVKGFYGTPMMVK